MGKKEIPKWKYIVTMRQKEKIWEFICFSDNSKRSKNEVAKYAQIQYEKYDGVEIINIEVMEI